jgi:hypothetical protein
MTEHLDEPPPNPMSLTVERARTYFQQVRSRNPADLPVSILLRVNGELLRHGEAMLTIFDDHFLPIPEAASEKGRAAELLLGEVPDSLRAPGLRHGDSAWAVATLIAALGVDQANEVTRWLRTAKHEAAAGAEHDPDPQP